METKELVERLEKFPALKGCVEEMLNIAENQEGKIVLADEAEERIILASRSLNRTALQTWADNQVIRQSGRFEGQHKSAKKDSKKKFNGTVVSGKSG